MADFLEESQVHEDGDYLQSAPLLELARGGRELRSGHDGMRFGVESRWLCAYDFLGCIRSLTTAFSTQGTLLTYTGESAPQGPLMLLVPSLPPRMLPFGVPRFHVGRHRQDRKGRRDD